MSSPSAIRPAAPPILVLFLGILAVSTASIFIRYAQVEVPSLVIAAWRLGLSGLILLPLALSRRRAELRAINRHELRLALLSGFFLALHFAAWITSLEYTSVASSVVLVTTTPLWVAVLAPLLLREALTRSVLLGMLLALGGGIVVGLNDACSLSSRGLACPPMTEFFGDRAFLGNFLALFGAWMAAGYTIIGRRLRASTSLLTYIFLVYGMAAVALCGFMLAAGESPFGYTPQAYLWLVLLALVPQLLGHSSFNWALRYLPAAYVSISLLGEPVGTTILAYFLLEERPTMVKIFGAILILVGILIASQRPGKSKVNDIPLKETTPGE